MQVVEWISTALGLDLLVQDVNALQMALRAAVIYVFALFAIKLAKRRFMGKNSAFDFVMTIILGSVISRAINGSAPFLPTLAASLVLIAMHRLVSWTCVRSKRFAHFVEGRPETLAENGRIDADRMRAHDITEQDLASALRQDMHAERRLAPSESVVLEPNGKLSIVRK